MIIFFYQKLHIENKLEKLDFEITYDRIKTSSTSMRWCINIEEELIELDRRIRNIFKKDRGSKEVKSSKKDIKLSKKRDDIIWGLLRRLYIIDDEIKDAKKTIESNDRWIKRNGFDASIEYEVTKNFRIIQEELSVSRYLMNSNSIV